METETILILLFVVATAVAIAVQRLAVPYTVALVFTGLVLGLLHGFEAPHLTKALLFNVFLPGLLFEAAFHIQFKQFWRNRLTINSLALPGVVVAIALTAVILTSVANGLHISCKISPGNTRWCLARSSPPPTPSPSLRSLRPWVFRNVYPCCSIARAS